MAGQRTVLRWDLDSSSGTLAERVDRLQREGAMVPSTQPLEVGALVDLEVAHAGVVAVTITATVRFVDPAGGGVGATVESSSEEQRQALTKFVAKMQASAPRQTSLSERLRGLGSAERLRLARNGEQAERVLLERIYGKAVWEALLQNPRITHPEVARIARMGALPKPLLEQIAGNRGWLSSGQVRRALLSSPRLEKSLILKVLQALPKHELRLMEKQTAYSRQVLGLARDLLQRR